MDLLQVLTGTKCKNIYKTIGKCENSLDIGDLNTGLIFIRWNNGIEVIFFLSPYLLEVHTEIFTSEML